LIYSHSTDELGPKILFKDSPTKYWTKKVFKRLREFVYMLIIQFYNSHLILLCFSKGMDTEKFKYKWGGEDWDLLDRVLNAKLEVERIKYPGLYHHYHSKQKKWD